MSSLGEYLKEARERKQLTLDDLQRITKIQKRYLKAIETGNFETLPGLFYARAFIKTYAETVGLDPEELFEQFKDELPNPHREVDPLPSRSERNKKQPPTQRRRRSSLIPTFITAGVVVLFIVAIWLFAQTFGANDEAKEPIAPNDNENVEAEIGDVSSDREEHEQNDEDEVDDSAIVENEEEETSDVEEEEKRPLLTFNGSEGNTSYFELNEGRLNDVRIELTGPSYIDIKNGLGKMFYAGEPQEGDVIVEDFTDEEEIIFNFGASQNVKLYISGEEVDFPLDIVHQKIAIKVKE